MRDPDEGVAADGTIVTGISRGRVPVVYEPVLTAVGVRLADWPTASVYLYGSVATGQAAVGRSDVDLLTFDLRPEHAVDIAGELNARFDGLCRGVEIAPARLAELRSASSAAYGLRVFLRHYCVHLGGPELHRDLPAYPADVRAARGFNGDIDQHLSAWRRRASSEPAALGRQVARKTLLALAGLISVVGSTWTTDRALAAREQEVRRPHLSEDLSTLLAWASGDSIPGRQGVQAVLRPGGVVERVVDEFAGAVGLWSGPYSSSRSRQSSSSGRMGRDSSCPV